MFDSITSRTTVGRLQHLPIYVYTIPIHSFPTSLPTQNAKKTPSKYSQDRDQKGEMTHGLRAVYYFGIKSYSGILKCVVISHFAT